MLFVIILYYFCGSEIYLLLLLLLIGSTGGYVTARVALYKEDLWTGHPVC